MIVKSLQKLVLF